MLDAVDLHNHAGRKKAGTSKPRILVGFSGSTNFERPSFFGTRVNHISYIQSHPPSTNFITDGQHLLRDDVLGTFSLLPALTTKMVDNKMEGVLQKHTAQIETHTTALLTNQDARLDPPNSKSRPHKNTTSQTEGMAINGTQYASACPMTCVCSCHRQAKAPAPAFINRVLGQLFVGAAGIPLLSTKCDYHACKSSRAPRVTVEYWFPLGVFWSQIVRLQVGYQANMGPQFSLRSLRRVPDSAQCVHYAMHGNIEGLKDLFRRGQASPLDVSSTRGYTLSRVSHEIFREAQSPTLD